MNDINSEEVHLIAVVDKSSLQIWDLYTEKQVTVIKSHHESTINVIHSTKNGYLVTGGKDNRVNFFG